MWDFSFKLSSETFKFLLFLSLGKRHGIYESTLEAQLWEDRNRISFNKLPELVSSLKQNNFQLRNCASKQNADQWKFVKSH